MSGSPAVYIHPVHMVFPFADLTSEEITVERFLELLEGIELTDRVSLIGLTAYALGVESGPTDDEESRNSTLYEGFKRACLALPAMNHLTLRGVVLEILNIHRRWADPGTGENAARIISEFVEFAKPRGNLTDAELTQWEVEAESLKVTKGFNAMIARRRYDLFCESVVRPLIGM